MSVPSAARPVTHHYLVHYPAHGPRPGDPHYAAFEAYRRKHEATAVCAVGAVQDPAFVDCSRGAPLELHHAHVEYALTNGVDPAALAKAFPGLDPAATPDQVDAWIESEANFMWLCVFHHRGAGGAHTAAAADWEAQKYVRGLITAPAGQAPPGPPTDAQT